MADIVAAKAKPWTHWDHMSESELKRMFAAASEHGQIEAFFACGRTLMRRVLQNGYIVRLEVKAPGQSRRAR